MRVQTKTLNFECSPSALQELQQVLYVRPQIPPQTQPKMWPSIRPQIRPKAWPQVSPLIRPQVSPLIRPLIWPQVRPLIRPLIRPQVRPLIQPQIRPQTWLLTLSVRCWLNARLVECVVDFVTNITLYFCY